MTPAPYRRHLDESLAPDARERMWLRIAAARRRPPRWAWRPAALGALAGAIAVAALALVWARPDHAPATATAPSFAQEPLAVTGSAPVVEAPLPVRQHGERIHGTGSLRSLAPGVVVAYRDASFVVTHERGVVRIEVERGSVDVSGAPVGPAPVHLTAGMLLEVPDDDAASAPVQPRTSAAASAPAPVDSVDVLLARADAARLAGKPADALAPLRTIVERHADDPRAALAALTLGRVELGELGSPGVAAPDLKRAIALGLPPALEEDAWVELVEAEARSGDAAAAQSAFTSAMARHPSPAHEAAMRKWIARD